MAFMAFMMMFFGTLTSGGFAVLVKGVKAAYEFAGTGTSLIFTIKNLAAFVFVFIATKYFDKLGLRLGIALAFVFGAVGMLICMIAGDNIILYYVASIFVGANYAFSMILPMALIVREWFNKKRALALSLVATATGLSGTIMTPIQTSMITNLGISTAFLIHAIMFVAFAVVFFLIFRSKPADVGLEPYGGANYVEEASGKGKKREAVALTTDKKAVIAFTICAFITGFCSPPSQQHLLLHFDNIGYDPMVAAAAYSLLSFMLLGTKPLFGILSTKFPIQYVSAAFVFCYVITLSLCGAAAFMGVISWLPFAITIIFGIAGASNTLGFPSWLADFTSKNDYPQKMKNAQFMYQGGEIVGSLIPGIVLDLTGSYSPWYFFAACCYLVSITLILTNYKRKNKLAASAE